MGEHRHTHKHMNPEWLCYAAIWGESAARPPIL